MAYLFQDEIEAALVNRPKDSALKRLQTVSTQITNELLLNHPHNHAYAENDQTAKSLAEVMGAKSSLGKAHHANDYCDWMLISDNCYSIRGKVLGELANAWKIGLDIRHHEVIGKMYQVAAEAYSAIDQYAGPSDAQHLKR